jgi:serine/threonine protein kinase
LQNLWKLTDFGFTSPATSSAKTSYHSRGSSGYRAPELLGSRGKRSFSSRSDIWPLACILYELAAGLPAFGDDFQTYNAYKHNLPPALPLASYSDFWRDKFTKCMRHLLALDPLSRPRAAQVCRALSTYCAAMGLPTPLECRQFPGAPHPTRMAQRCLRRVCDV